MVTFSLWYFCLQLKGHPSNYLIHYPIAQFHSEKLNCYRSIFQRHTIRQRNERNQTALIQQMKKYLDSTE
jgi:hypothetical protein